MAIEGLRDDDFYIERCRELFRVMKSMVNEKIPVDTITLESRLKSARLDELSEFAIEIAERIGTIANCEGYIELLRQIGGKRRLSVAANEIDRMCYDPDLEYDSIVDNSEKLIQDAVVKESGTQESNMTEIMSMTIDHMEKVHTGTRYGVPTGFKKLDDLMGGYEPDQLIIVAGRPGMGKTSFATATALYLGLEHKIPTAIFSLEMSKVQLGQRMLSQWAEINLLKLRNGWVPKRDYPAMYEKITELAEAPIYVDDCSLLTLPQLRSKARKLIAKRGVKMIIIDYVQLMGYSESDPNIGISKITRGLKMTSKDLGVPVMLLSQLSRANEKRTKVDVRPKLSDLRSSGAIEQDADVVLFTHRHSLYDEKVSNNDIEVIIGKQRCGPLDTAHLYYIPECSMLKNEAPETW